MRSGRNGKEFKLHQFANDWITGTRVGDGAPVTTGAHGVYCSLEEWNEMLKMKDNGHVGLFFDEHTYVASVGKIVKRLDRVILVQDQEDHALMHIKCHLCQMNLGTMSYSDAVEMPRDMLYVQALEIRRKHVEDQQVVENHNMLMELEVTR